MINYITKLTHSLTQSHTLAIQTSLPFEPPMNWKVSTNTASSTGTAMH